MCMELKIFPEAGSQSRYAFERGAYLMRTQGQERCRSLELFVGIRANALRPISRRFERDGGLPNQCSAGVLPSMVMEPVTLVRNAAVAINLSQR